MNVVLLLAVQSLFAGAAPEESLPKFGDLEPRASSMQPQEEPYPWLGLEAMAVWTNFDSGLRIKNAWGFGGDATVTLDYGKRAFLGFRLGYVGWNTRTDGTAVPADSVWVRQYRLGIFGAFQFRFMELRIGAVAGGYRFRRDGEDDTAGFFEFEAGLGARPSEFVWLGIRAMQTFTVSSFNHAGDHSYVNYSIGPAVEVRF
jgi:hypothetical protein